MDVSVEDHADPRKLEKIVAKQMIKFLQAQGVDTREKFANEHEDLQEYLTGSVVYTLVS